MSENETGSEKHFKLKVSHVLIILFLAGVGVFAYFRFSLKSKLQSRIDAIRAAGYPVTCAELDKWYKIPPNVENAAYTILDAFSYYNLWDKEKADSLLFVGQAKLPARTEPMDEEMKALIAQHITDNNEALKMLHAGAAIEHCRYPIDLNAGFDATIPNLSEILEGVYLLKLEAVLYAEKGDSKSAICSIKSCFGIARSLATEPVTISQSVRSACQKLAVTTIEYCINRIKFTDEQLIELMDSVQNAERVSDISCALVGERCAGISFFRDPFSVNPDFIRGISFRPILAFYNAIGMSDSDAIIYLDIMEGYINSTQLPYHKRLEAIWAIDARIQKTSKAHVLLHAIIPRLTGITFLGTRNFAQLLTARVGLAIERCRLATGKLPDVLSELVPVYLDAVPTDPYDGKDLRYEKLGVGFVVYSIGEDLRDDGGSEELQAINKRGESWDVTFIVER